MPQRPVRTLLFVFLVMASTSFAAFDLASQRPPLAKQRPKDVSVHGDKRVDPFFWLRDRKNTEVRDYLRAENDYTQRVMEPTKSLQNALYKEILGRIQEDDVSQPTKKGNYLYYNRTEKGKQYSLHCRRPALAPGAPGEVILDVNAIAEGTKFTEIGHLEISDDGKFMAYSVDTNGDRDYELRIRNLETMKDLPISAKGVYALNWASDNETVFFASEETDSRRSYRIESLNLNTGKRRLIMEEKDEEWDFDVSRSRDGKYLFFTSSSKTASEVNYLRADEPEGMPKVIAPRSALHEYYADHRDGLFYFITNRDAKDFRAVTAPVDHPEEANWKEWLPQRPGVKLESLDLFRHFALIEGRESGLPVFEIHNFDTGERRRIEMSEPCFAAEQAENLDNDAKEIRIHYESPVTPPTLYAFNVETLERRTLKQVPVLGGYSADDYACDRILVPVKVGSAVPVSIVFKKSLRRDGPQPLLLYGYGAYGISESDSFSTSRLSLLDRGWIFAIAHVRGGGELGHAWHDQGKMQLKQNTFSDFIACSEALIHRRFTSPDHLVITGGSAGGLLVGAVINQRPDLYQGAILDVPFVDVINTMLDDSLPLTTAEYQEWGNPNLTEEYHWMRSYSPYDNLSRQPYPAILVNVSFQDSQVPYWEGAKYVARLRTLKTDKNALLLHTNLDAGHSGASGRYDSLKEVAFEYAFALTCLENK